MAWWLWLVLGGVLAAVELLGDAAFYFIFLGAAALLVGVLELSGAALPVWAQWLLFALASVVSMVLFRRKLYERFRGGLPGFDNADTGAVVNVSEEVAVGGRTRVQLRGSHWTATNVGANAIPAGAPARVVETTGTHVTIEALPQQATTPQVASD